MGNSQGTWVKPTERASWGKEGKENVGEESREGEGEEKESMEEVRGNLASIHDAQEAKHPAEHAYLTYIQFCRLPRTQVLVQLNASFQNQANSHVSIAAVHKDKIKIGQKALSEWEKGLVNGFGRTETTGRQPRLSNDFYRLITLDLSNWRKQLSVQNHRTFSAQQRAAG